MILCIPSRYCKICKEQGRGLQNMWYVDDGYDPKRKEGMSDKDYNLYLKGQEQNIMGCIICQSGVSTNELINFGDVLKQYTPDKLGVKVVDGIKKKIKGLL